MTKEEILDSHYQTGKHWKVVNRAKVLEAMEEYKMQFIKPVVEDIIGKPKSQENIEKLQAIYKELEITGCSF